MYIFFLADYTPILIRNPNDVDFRMRSVGIVSGHGPRITVFDMVCDPSEPCRVSFIIYKLSLGAWKDLVRN